MYEFLMNVSVFILQHSMACICATFGFSILVFYFLVCWETISEQRKTEVKFFGEHISGRLDDEEVYLQKLVVTKLFALKNKVISSNEKLELIEEEVAKIKESEGYKSLTTTAMLEKTIQFRNLSSEVEKAKWDFDLAAETAYKAGFVHEAAIMGYGVAEDELEFGKPM
jgi:hypothetical protein